MSNISEKIVSSAYRTWSSAEQLWKKYSFSTLAKDVSLNDGTDMETKTNALSEDIATNATNIATNSEAITELNNALEAKFDSAKIKYGTTGTSTTGEVIFAEPFDNANYVVLLTPANSNSELTFVYNVTTKTASGFKFNSKYTKDFSTFTTHNAGIAWLALHL